MLTISQYVAAQNKRIRVSFFTAALDCKSIIIAKIAIVNSDYLISQLLSMCLN